MCLYIRVPCDMPANMSICMRTSDEPNTCTPRTHEQINQNTNDRTTAAHATKQTNTLAQKLANAHADKQAETHNSNNRRKQTRTPTSTEPRARTHTNKQAKPNPTSKHNTQAHNQTKTIPYKQLKPHRRGSPNAGIIGRRCNNYQIPQLMAVATCAVQTRNQMRGQHYTNKRTNQPTQH